MRFLIVLAALLLVPAAAVILEWRFEPGQRELLEAEARQRLDKAGLDKVTVTLDHFDAHLSGTCPDPADRQRAESIITGMHGPRVLPWENNIRVPSKVTATISGQLLKLSGWLPSDGRRKEAVALAKVARPDLEISDDIRVSSYVEMGRESAENNAAGMPRVFATLLKSIRLPASLSITGDGRRYELKGSLPSAELRDAIVEAAKKSGAGLEIDASRLQAHEQVQDAPFVQGTGLVDFVRSFFSSPTPGSFQIDERNGPRIRAYATAPMESEWLGLLRAVAGGAKVNAEITRVPSLYHFPTYKPQSALDTETVSRLRDVFRTQIILFETGSSKIKPDEEAKVPPLAELIINAGPGIHLILAGYADLGGEPGTKNKTVQRARAEAVKSKLVHLGVKPEVLETQVFEAMPPNGPVTDDARRQSRSVELLIK